MRCLCANFDIVMMYETMSPQSVPPIYECGNTENSAENGMERLEFRVCVCEHAKLMEKSKFNNPLEVPHCFAASHFICVRMQVNRFDLCSFFPFHSLEHFHTRLKL